MDDLNLSEVYLILAELPAIRDFIINFTKINFNIFMLQYFQNKLNSSVVSAKLFEG